MESKKIKNGNKIFVKIISVISLIFSLFSLPRVIFAFFIITQLSLQLIVVIIMDIIASILLLVSSSGMILYKNWARKLFLICLGLTILSHLIGIIIYFSGSRTPLLFSLPGMLVSLALFIYFNTKGVKIVKPK